MPKRLILLAVAAALTAAAACAPEQESRRPASRQPVENAPAPSAEDAPTDKVTFSLPLLELKRAGGKWLWHHDEQPITDYKALLPLLAAYAAHRDAEAGWPGVGQDTISENPLVVQIDANAPWAHSWPVVEAMVAARMPKLVVGTTQHIKARLDKAFALDPTSLPDGYLFAELPRDEGQYSGSVASYAEIRLYPRRNGFVRLGVRWSGFKEGLAGDDALTASDLILAGHSKVAESRRSELIASLVTALEEQIRLAATDVQVVKLTAGSTEAAIADLDKSAPWVFVEIGALALAEVNARRIAAGKQALRTEMPWQQWPVPEPVPEPEPLDPSDKPEPEPPPEPGMSSGLLPVPPEDSEDPANQHNNGDVPPDLDVYGGSPPPSEKKPPVGLAGGSSGPGMIGPSPLLHRRSAPGRDNQAHVDAALQWLADHQDPEGFWSADKFSAASKRKEATSTGNIEFSEPGADFSWGQTTEVGLTGLALMAFAANGLDHRQGDHKLVVRGAIIHLRRTQHSDGGFGSKDEDHSAYNHAIATTALAEQYALSRDRAIKPILDRAVEFIVMAQNPGMGWRYGIRPTYNDSSVTGWMLLALHSAKLAGIEIDVAKIHVGAFKWFDTATDKDENGRWRTGYDVPRSTSFRLPGASDYELNPALDAIHGSALLAGALAEGGTAAKYEEKLADFEKSIAENPPKWEHKKLDYYYWFWAAMFMQQRSGKARDTWWEAASEVLTKHQRGWHELDTKAERTTAAKLAEHGSWDAVDAWSTAGGRVYATAMGALTLSMPWRFAPATGKGTPETPKDK